jgi:hypothetical protein
MQSSNRAGPGLAKTRGDRLVVTRVLTSVRGSDGRFRAMFANADAVSEGAVRLERALPIWYGTTSLILPWPAGLPASSRGFVTAVALRDPHVRLRAVRWAHQEACTRAPGPLGRAECDVRMSAEEGGLRIDVDVQAPLTLRSNLGLSGRGPRD